MRDDRLGAQSEDRNSARVREKIGNKREIVRWDVKTHSCHVALAAYRKATICLPGFCVHPEAVDFVSCSAKISIWCLCAKCAKLSCFP